MIFSFTGKEKVKEVLSDCGGSQSVSKSQKFERDLCSCLSQSPTQCLFLPRPMLGPSLSECPRYLDVKIGRIKCWRCDG